MLAGLWQKKKPSSLLMKMASSLAYVKNNMNISPKIRNSTLVPSNITFCYLYPKHLNTNLSKRMFSAMLSTIAMILKQPQCQMDLMDEWI